MVGPDACPSEELVVEFLSGRLTVQELETLELHAARCAPCLELLTTAARDPDAPPEPLPDAVPDQRFGPYRVVGRLGRGGMGVVYRAIDERNGQEVAVKTVRLPERTALLSLRSEIHTLGQLRHPGVVRILEQGQLADDVPWYAMELVTGKTLAQLIEAGTDRAMLLAVVRGLCTTLAVVHAARIVHRDLSPQNVIVQPDGTPVLVDFGLALTSVSGPAPREVLRLESARAGTVNYMSPEQIRGEPVDARTDLYALGCVLFEALTGAPPFAGVKTAAIIGGHLGAAPVAPSRARPGSTPALDALVLRLLSKHPRDRFGFADQVAREIDRAGVVSRRAPPLAREVPTAAYLYRPSLIGREDVLEALDAAAARCQQGEGGLVLLTGSSGVGKTRVAVELATRAHRCGFDVALGSCPAPPLTFAASARPLAPFKSLLERVAERCHAGGPAETARLLGARGRVLTDHEEALARVPGIDDLPALPPIPGDGARVRVLDALEHALGALAKDGPVAVILDDLQWADELSLAFLNHLSPRFFAEHPVLVVGTYRDEEILPEVASRLSSRGPSRFHLGRLDEAGIATMVDEMLATDAPPEELLPLLRRRAGGNPYFVIEYLRTALAEGRLHRAGGQWRLRADTSDAESLSTPVAVRALVLRRLERLDAMAAVLAEVAAVLGRELDGEQLLALAEKDFAGAGPQGLVGAFAELCLRNVLEPSERGQYRFVHDQLRDAAYERISPERRRELHGRAAALLAAASTEGTARIGHDAALATHYTLAGEHARAFTHLAEAADRALRAGSAGEARALVDRALALADREKLILGRESHARLQRLRAEAAFAQANLSTCRTDARAALSAAGHEPPGDRAGWQRLIFVEGARHVLHRALPARWVRAKGADRLASAEGAAAAGLLASAVYFAGDSLELGGALLLGANLAERADSPAHVVASFSQLGYVAGLKGMAALSRRYFSRAFRIARASGERRPLALALYLRAFQDLGHGRWDAAERAAEEALEILEGIGDLQDADVARTIAAHAVFYGGRVEEARDRYRALAISARRRENEQHVGWGLALEARSLMTLGRAEEAVPLLAEARGMLASLADVFSIAMCEGLLASAHRERGRMFLARTVAEELRPKLTGDPLPLAPCLHAYLGAAEVALAVWDEARDDESRAIAHRSARALARFARMFPMAVPAALAIESAVAERDGQRRRARSLARRSAHRGMVVGMIPRFGVDAALPLASRPP